MITTAVLQLALLHALELYSWHVCCRCIARPTAMTAEPPKQGWTALITGATGIQGTALLDLLEKDERFKGVWAVSRRGLPREYNAKIKRVQLDLNDKEGMAQSLDNKGVKEITHIYHLAFHGDQTNVDEGVAEWLFNVAEAVERTSEDTLSHVFFQEGIKYYGCHWGKTKTPMDERDPRHLRPQYYYTMEDWAIEKTKSGARWTWSSLRPPYIIGVNVGSAMNILANIAVYGVFCKEEGIAMRFPGTDATYNAVYDVVDNHLLMDAAVWSSTHKEAANQAYNINNGDTFRWKHLWPELAAWFGLEADEPLRLPMTKVMPLKKKQWKDIRQKYNLADHPYEEIAKWEAADALFNLDADLFSNTLKLRQAGYEGARLDTKTNFYERLEEMADRGIIPRYNKKQGLKDLLDRSIESTKTFLPIGK
eukprot:jgi/Astpho2/8459/fgenesh1_pg.00123_%23_27_t